MNLIISYLSYTQVNLIISRICFYLFLIGTSVSLGATPVDSDLALIDDFIENNTYKKAISYADKAHQQYLSIGDTLAAYSVLVKKLKCFKEAEMNSDFVELSEKILLELSPDQFTQQQREVRNLRCKFLSHKDLDAYYEELVALCAFEKEYGTEEKYIDIMLHYVSALNIMGNRDLDISMELLSRIENLEKTRYQTFDYNRSLAYIMRNRDAKKADSIYHLAERYLDDVELIKTKAGFLREYAHFLAMNEEFASSIEYSLRALKYYEAQPNRFAYTLAAQLTYLADNFRKIGKLDIARQYIDRALAIAEEKKIRLGKSFARSNADLLMVEGEIEKAQEEYRRAIDFTAERYTHAAIDLYAKYGNSFLRQNDIRSAEKVAMELQEYMQDLGNKEDYFTHLLLNARIAMAKNDHISAEKQLLTILSQEINIPPGYKSEILDKLSTIYKSKGDFAQALNYTDQYLILKDSLNNNIALQSALHLEAQFNREQQNDKIALLDRENQIHEMRLSSQRKFLIFTSCAFLAFLLISFLLLSLFRKVKSQNEIINKSLSEKDTLLKEIHHRVKNNLQLVSSLLTLQSRDIKDVKAIEAINEGKARVRSMALIHQDLYSRDNLTGIGMKKYLENLSQELFSTYQLEEQDIRLDLNIDDLYLDVDTIVPIGLIINELITNALKYAFKGRESGVLSIAFKENMNRLILDVKDNGKGLEYDNFIKSNSFGNKLINTLTEQLDGSMKVDGNNGTHIHLEFKDYKLAS